MGFRSFMAVSIMQRADGTKGAIPQDVVVTFNYGINAEAVDTNIFIAGTSYEVVKVQAVPTVAGTDVGAVTADVMKCTGTQAPSAGATVCASADGINLKGTINTVQDKSLAATVANRKLAAGDRLAVNFTGVLTAAVGLIQVNLKRLKTEGGDI